MSSLGEAPSQLREDGDVLRFRLWLVRIDGGSSRAWRVGWRLIVSVACASIAFYLTVRVCRSGKVGLGPSILYAMARVYWEVGAVGQRRHYHEVGISYEVTRYKVESHLNA